MKKLILLLTICILTSCGMNFTSTPLIITDINDTKDKGIYSLTVNNKIEVITNIKYNIGDTLK